jgi:hypothetical protein
MMRLTWNAVPYSRAASDFSNCLLRSIPVSLRWTNSLDHQLTGAGNCNASSVLQLLPPLLLHELDAFDCTRSGKHWRRILAHPSLQQLRSLSFGAHRSPQAIDLAVLRLIAALPYLHSLRLDPGSCNLALEWPLYPSPPSSSSMRGDSTPRLVRSCKWRGAASSSIWPCFNL